MPSKTKKAYRALRRPLEWLAIALAMAVIPPLSLRGLVRLAHVLADLGYLFDRRGKAIARANLRLMFGRRMTPWRERALIRGSYRNMTRVLLNLFWMARDTRARMALQVSFAPGVLESVIASQPAVTVSGHFGNWEILSQACVAGGVPMMSIAKRIGSKEMTEGLSRLRKTIGQELVPADGALRPLLAALRRGVSIGLLVDQQTPVRDGGAWVELFGARVAISLAPAALARKTRSTIVFAWSRPLKDGRYRIEPGVLLPPDPPVGDAERVQQITAAFERVIRRHPSLWCLNYRRWRSIPPGDDPARYPFYAAPDPDAGNLAAAPAP